MCIRDRPIGSRLRTFQRAIGEPCTLPLSSLKGGTKCDFLLFLPVKFNFLSKEVCYKVSLCENFQPPSTYNLHSKWPTPSENADFDRFRFVQASEKSSIIANRKSTMSFPSSYINWTLCVTPESFKGWLKTRIFTFGVAFYFFVAGNRRHLRGFSRIGISAAMPLSRKCL